MALASPAAASSNEWNQQGYVPPLPAIVTDILSAASLCYLATSEDNIPHLSLMNYTVVDDADVGLVIVLSTRRDTKKFQAIQSNPQVALLVHDFSASGTGGTASVTITGEITEAAGSQAAHFRAAHLARNPNMAQFIAGDHMAVLFVTPAQVRFPSVSCIRVLVGHPHPFGGGVTP